MPHPAIDLLLARRSVSASALGEPGPAPAEVELMLKAASRVPALGTMPVIGALFRSQAFKRGQTELVIIVTPVIVNPTSGRRISTPIDNFVPPNDFERILLGRFQGNPRGREAVQSGIGQRRLAGPSGFVFQ